MKKLSLELDALRVESFETAGAGAGRAGTVRAHSIWAEAAETAEAPIPVTHQWSCTCPADAGTTVPGAA